MRYKGQKGRIWEKVKKYTRLRDTDCYTCPAKELVSFNAQAGHYLPVALVGSNNTLSWDPVQIRLQCGACNGKGQGMQVEYRRHLVKDLGEEEVLKIEQRRWRVDPVRDWKALESQYDSLIASLS